MSPRRIMTVFGPAAALGALVAAIGVGCMSWSFELPAASAFVSRNLSRGYGIALGASPTTRVSLLPLPRLGFRDVRLTAGSPSGPVLAEGGSLAIQLSLTALLLGRVEVVSLALDGATVALPGAGDDARWTGPYRRLVEHLSEDDAAHPRRITLSNLTLTGTDSSDGARDAVRDVDLILSWPLWSDALHAVGGLAWHGGTARFALTGLRAGDLFAGRTSPFAVTATWGSGSLKAEGSGTIADGFALTGRGSLEAESLPETLAWAGSGIALSPLIGAVALEGGFELTPDALRLPDLRVSANGTTLEGAGSLELGGHRPSIRATLATESLNLGPMLAGTLRIAGLDGASEGWGRQALDLGPLVGGDLDLRLSAGTARLGPLVMSDVASSVIVREDGIDAALGRASVQGGTVKGRVVVTAKPATGETEVRALGAFDGLDLGAVLVDLGEYGWVLGATQGSFALEGRGRDAASLVGRVSGRGTLAVSGGAIAGLDLVDVLNRGPAQGALARRNGRTPFERAALSLTFTDGIGEIAEGTLSARTLTATLRGQLSLPDRHFRARAELLPRSASAGEATTGSATLFEIRGPWDAVAVQAVPKRNGATAGADRLADPPGAPAAALPPLSTNVRAYAP